MSANAVYHRQNPVHALSIFPALSTVHSRDSMTLIV